MGFKDVLGNEVLIKHIKNAILLDKVSHAYIINGEKGMGKKLITSLFSMALQCSGDGEKPCMKCQSCNQMISGNHPDIFWVTHEKPASIGVEDIRVQVNNKIMIKPYSSPYKIYIIDEAEKLTVQAQNALLKTIEEPPGYAVIFLLTTNMEKFLPTIVSRCVTLNMRPIDDEQLKEYIINKTGVPDYEANVIIAFSNGNLGKALKLASSEEFNKMKDEIINLLKNLPDMETYEIIASAKSLNEFKLDIYDCIDLMIAWFRDVLLYKLTKDLDNLVFKDEYKYISIYASKSSYNDIENIIEAMEKTKVRLIANVNFDLALELMFLKIKENIT